jgi:hypothetical protein
MRRAWRTCGHAPASVSGGISRAIRCGRTGRNHRPTTQQHREQTSIRHDPGEQPACGAFAYGAYALLVDNLPPDVEQAAVLHARRTGRFARATGQTAIEMNPRP